MHSRNSKGGENAMFHRKAMTKAVAIDNMQKKKKKSIPDRQQDSDFGEILNSATQGNQRDDLHEKIKPN